MGESKEAGALAGWRAAGSKRLGLLLALVGCGLWIAFGAFDGDRRSPTVEPPSESQEPAAVADALAPIPALADPGPLASADSEQRTPLVASPGPELASEDPQSLVAERDLLVRVLGPGGELKSGICVGLMLRRPDSTWTPLGEDMRVSGSPDQELRFDSQSERDPEWQGRARWDAQQGTLREHWRAFDAGKALQLPRLAVGAVLPYWSAAEGGQPQVVELELDAWPAQGLDLQLQAGVLELYEPLRVDVYHANGQPAVDVPLGLLGIPTSSAMGNGSFFGEARSDSKGVAMLPLYELNRLSALVGSAAGMKLPLRDLFSFWVAPTYPTHLLQKVVIPGGPGGPGAGQSVRLELPPVARVRASFWTTKGEPYPLQDTAMQLRVNWDRGSGPRDEFYGKSIRDSVQSSVVDLGWVGQGIVANANAWPEDGDVPGVQVELPAIDGTRDVELRFVFGERNLRLAWRLLGLDGEPLRDTQLAYCLRDQDLELRPTRTQQRHWRQAQTDAEGRFLWVMGSPLRDPKAMDFLLGGEQAYAFGSVNLPQELPARPEPEESGALPVVHMGELRLSAKELPRLPQPVEEMELPLADGRVLDESGQPLKGVTVTAYAAGRGRSRHMGRTRSDGDGVFHLRCVDPEAFYLVMDKHPYVLRSTLGEAALQPGASGLQYTLHPGLELKLSFDSFKLPFGEYLKVEAVEGERRYRARQQADGAFRFSRLPAGNYSVSIQAEGMRTPLVSFADVKVSPELAQPDARLEGIDLRSLAYARWYTFEDSLGAPISAREVSLRVAGFPRVRSDRDTNGTSRLFLILPRAALSVEFGVKDVGFAQVPMGDEDVTVRLLPGR